jgi:hypothetical protein
MLDAGLSKPAGLLSGLSVNLEAFNEFCDLRTLCTRALTAEKCCGFGGAAIKSKIDFDIPLEGQ